MDNNRSRWCSSTATEECTGLKIRPFENLASLVKAAKKHKKHKKTKSQSSRPKNEPAAIKSDDEIFLEAMKGVRRLHERDESINLEAVERRARDSMVKKEVEDLEQGVRELSAVIKGERPLPVEKIPEYMDGPAFNMDRGLVRKLRKGRFAIGAYCELHGLRADEALQVMDGFMSDALMNNLRAIAFIHGRGKSSPGEPVLKGLVKDFLNRGRFRRYVLAYSSAPAWDGGPGVTYVLLRKRPVKKTKRR